MCSFLPATPTCPYPWRVFCSVPRRSSPSGSTEPRAPLTCVRSAGGSSGVPGQGGSSPPAVRLPVRIAGTADVRCGRAVPTSEVARLATGSWDAEDVERRTGIRSRQWVSEDAMLTSLGAQALQDALDEAGLPATALGRIIFASSAGGDMLAPAAANLIARELGLTGTCDGFDLNNGCVGFLSALDVGGQTVVARRRPVGLVMVEPGSRYITPD